MFTCHISLRNMNYPLICIVTKIYYIFNNYKITPNRYSTLSFKIPLQNPHFSILPQNFTLHHTSDALYFFSISFKYYIFKHFLFILNIFIIINNILKCFNIYNIYLYIISNNYIIR